MGLRDRLVVHVHELIGAEEWSVEWKHQLKEERHVGLRSVLGTLHERNRRMGAVLRGVNP